MLVYGERSRTSDPRKLVEALRRAVDELAAFPPLPPVSSRPEPRSGGKPGPPQAEGWEFAAVPDRPAAVRDDSEGSGITRHAALVSALIEAGELAQGLADAAFEVRGEDGADPRADAAMALTVALARAVTASWRSGFTAGDLSDAGAALDALAAQPLPAIVRTKVGEGYAFYALYPEAYAEAAAGLDPAPTTVVGLRSIGTSLAAVVAAALEAPPPITLRPVGHPFRRTLSLAPDTAAILGEGGADPDRRYAVVDEGPGLSGSSFGCVLDRLESAGVSRERMIVFPGHGGDLGPQADPAHRARWAGLDRRGVGFEALALDAADPAHRLETWVEDLTGPAVAPLRDLSGGAWRELRFADEARRPPSHTLQERRKYLMRTERGAFLLKFAGLGRTGERKLARARALAAAGFCLGPLGLRHGFLVEPWVERAGTAEPGLDRLAAYLACRAHAFPAGREDGASVAELWEMAHANAAEGLGVAVARALERWRPALSGLEAARRPMLVDGRLHRWEWIAGPGGVALKTDAVDHADAHDLVGAQDIAWDVAGAEVEFDLDPGSAQALRRAVERRAGRAVDAGLVAFCRVAYPAFQLGLWTMAAQAHEGAGEHARLAAIRDRYADRLIRAAGSPPPG